MIDDDHQRFLGRLRRSTKAVQAVAEWLLRHGREVYVPEIREAPTAAEAHKYGDDGDLIVDGHLRVEVKQVLKPFTCAEDWPFNGYFVDNEEKVARRNVAAYIRVNPDRTHVGILLPESRKLWTVREITNTNTYRSTIRVLVSPVSCVLFKKIATKSRQ